MTNPELLDCEEVLRVMFAYVDGELSAAHKERVESHLQRCRGCFSRAEFERLLKNHLAELANGSGVSPAFEQRIRSLLDGFGSPAAEEDPRPAK